MGFQQVKTFYVGSDFVGDVPLSKKILAALTTGIPKLNVVGLICLFANINVNLFSFL